MPEEKKVEEKLNGDQLKKVAMAYQKADGTLDEEEFKYAKALMEQVNEDLKLREQPSDVFNGIPYSDAYVYNRRKAINYSPPSNTEDDREVSFGTVHEKIVVFCGVFLKYIWKRRVISKDKHGRKINGLGDVFDLAVEHSKKLEKFSRKILLIIWEVFTQGNAFVLENWEVRVVPRKKAYTKNAKGEEVEVTPDNMDYTYEFLEGLRYVEDTPVQERMAKATLLDGRQVIFGDPEVEDVQEQPRLTIEMQFPRSLAEQLYGSLKRWSSVPTDSNSIMVFSGNTTTLFDSKRLKKPEETVLAHFTYDRFRNVSNVFLNGVMMLPRQTTMDIFYPRMNYPLSNVAGERLTGSIYARSIPAKTKFNADFVDWTLKVMAEKFEQGAFPAILSHGKYTLNRKMFRGGQVTHGINKEDYEKADPENKGVTQAEFSFVNFMKEILNSQSANPTTSGDVQQGATATEISLMENHQNEKLGFFLDGLMLGMMDIDSRRIETIESKYTTIAKKTLVDSKELDVYQNFTVQAYGNENHVIMDPSVGNEGFDVQNAKDTLFEMSFQDKKQKGISSKYFVANPIFIRKREYTNDVEIISDRRKDTGLQMSMMWEEFEKLLATFQGRVNMDTLKEEYLEVSGRPEDIFNSKDMEQLQREQAAQQSAQSGQEPTQQPQKMTPKPTPQMMNQNR